MHKELFITCAADTSKVMLDVPLLYVPALETLFNRDKDPLKCMQ